jgi:hypothetical protein
MMLETSQKFSENYRRADLSLLREVVNGSRRWLPTCFVNGLASWVIPFYALGLDASWPASAASPGPGCGLPT